MINKIRIQNFRSLVDVSVDLEPLTVLIGRSGTGKSNFVQAIRFLRDGLNTRSMNANTVGGILRVLHIDHPKQPVGYNVQFSIAGIAEPFQYALQVNPTGGQVLDEYLKQGEKLLFHQATSKWVRSPEVVPAPPPQGIMLGAIPGLQESSFAYVALRSGIGCYDLRPARGVGLQQGLQLPGVDSLGTLNSDFVSADTIPNPSLQATVSNCTLKSHCVMGESKLTATG